MGQTRSSSAVASRQQTKSYGSVEDKRSYAPSAGEKSFLEDTKNDSSEHWNNGSPEAKAEHVEHRRQENSQRFVDLVTETGLKTLDLDYLEIETDMVLITFDSDIPGLKYTIRYHPEMKAYIVSTTFAEDEFSCTRLLCSDTKMLVSTHNDYYTARKGRAYPTIQEYVDTFRQCRREGRLGDCFADIVTVDYLRRSGLLPAIVSLTEEMVERIYPYQRSTVW